MSARTKGVIMNRVTGEYKPFIYNPTTFSNSRSVNYTSIKSAGSSYPLTQYVNGNEKQISFELFLYDKVGNKVNEYIDFLNTFLPVKGTRFNVPPTLIYSFGNYVSECVLLSLETEYTDFDINLKPTSAKVKISLMEV